MEWTKNILNKAFFGETSRFQLQCFRSIYVFVIFLQLLAEKKYMNTMIWQLYDSFPIFVAHNSIFYILLASLIAVGLGIWSHIFLWISFASYILYQYPISSTYDPHYNILPIFVLLILAMDSKMDRQFAWSKSQLVGQRSDWPLQTVKFTLGLTYLAAFFAKLINSGWGWIDGSVLTTHFVERSLLQDISLPLWIAQQEWLCIALAILALAFEGLFWTVVLFRRFELIYAVAGVAFHWGIYITMALNFSHFYVPTYLVFIPFSFLLLRLPLSFKKLPG